MCRFSEWDLRLNRFKALEEGDMETNYNTLISFMQVSLQKKN